MKTRKVLLGLLLVLITNLTLAQAKEETEALKQFVAFCKIRIDVENAHNMIYTPLVLKAIDIEGNVLHKDYVKTELEKVLTEDSIQNQFLTFFGGLTSNKTNMYYLLKPPYTDFTISAKDANILSNYILTNYPKHIVEPNLEEESEQEEKEVYVYPN